MRTTRPAGSGASLARRALPLVVQLLCACALVQRATAHGIPPRLATVMAEVGERFARLGAAITTRNDDLAIYQARQIAELLERDMVLATPPRPLFGMDLDPPRLAFRDGPWRALKDAVDGHDAVASATAFSAAAAACNECHRTTGVAFLVVPGLPPAPAEAKKGQAKKATRPASSAPRPREPNASDSPAR